MSEESSPRLPWTRIVAEGAAIIVSILLAFAIDAWWGSTQERAEEQTALNGLQAEFEENRSRLEGNMAGHRRTEAAAFTLLSLSDGRGEVTSDSLMYLLRRVFIDAYSYNPSSGVLDGLIASGELSLIRDQDLRGLLASWPGQLEENAEDEAWVFKDVQDVYTPFLNRALPTRDIWATGVELPTAEASPDYTAVLGGTEFESLVAMRAYGAGVLLEENQALLELIDEILELVRGDIE